ncbi:MAG TPA: hypothetical protein PKA28_05690 [Methylomusa anaerophila]|uniref:CRISPR-associated protein n=1 Tax=Methylomusa anaerophila TaxID=1930071 RepID=A0A348ALW5_9FIRM|nr:hypothetical protein [Methylomusa anaerophila]BBB92063.1 CRISPR-associated protein [Methylomusa anaerophila]HML87925.1 hypothetical protein [Methylomusa anaerophila]
MKRIVTTVGASIFENYKHQHLDFGDLYARVQRPHTEWEGLKPRIERIKKAVLPWAQNNDIASAEISSILKIERELGETADIIFLATDTVDSRLAAEIIFEAMLAWPGDRNVVFNPKEDIIAGLQVENCKTLERDGLPNLIECLYKIIQETYFENTVFNITGGYKAIIPCMTIMAQVNKIPIYYTFERTNELIRIPQAPIEIDYGIFEKYSHVLGDLKKGIEEDWKHYCYKHNIGEDIKNCVWEEEGMAALNSIGQIFWQRYQSFIFIEVPRGGKYFTENDPNVKRELNRAIRQMFSDISNFNFEIQTLRHDQIKHVAIEDTYVYKSTNPPFRIQYKITPGKKIRLINYCYINSDHVHDRYEALLREEYNIWRKADYTVVSFPK